ncbi:MAG: membrane fusion protein [Oceanicoccus sp.]|jgi:membrane fusion protein
MDSLFRKEAINNQRTRLYGDVILTQPTSYYAISLVIILMLILCGLFLWSQNYTRKESVQGYLVPSKDISKVYSNKAGILEQILVESGQEVKKGDPIARIRLEGQTFSGVGSQENIRNSLLREQKNIRERLEKIPKKLTYDITTLTSLSNGYNSELLMLEIEAKLYYERLQLSKKQYSSIVKLARHGHVSTSKVGERRTDVLQIQQEILTQKHQVQSVTNSLNDTQLKINNLPHRYDTERSTLISQQEQLIQQLANMENRSGYTVFSPVDGIVSGVYVNEGRVVSTTAFLIASILPEGSELVGRLLIPSRSSGLIEADQVVRLQYDAFPYQRFGVFTGKIVDVSTSILTPVDFPSPIQIQESFYLATADLDSQRVNVGDRRIPLKSGMQFVADITLENRSLLQWVFDPILSLRSKL